MAIHQSAGNAGKYVNQGVPAESTRHAACIAWNGHLSFCPMFLSRVSVIVEKACCNPRVHYRRWHLFSSPSPTWQPTSTAWHASYT
jgi:hypothetical protein